MVNFTKQRNKKVHTEIKRCISINIGINPKTKRTDVKRHLSFFCANCTKEFLLLSTGFPVVSSGLFF